MGKHFDGLVKLLNDRKSEFQRLRSGKDSGQEIKDIIDRAHLFEFGISSNDVFAFSGKEQEEYVQCLKKFYDLSLQYQRRLLTPFETTAIEDLESVVILDPTPDEFGVFNFLIGEESEEEKRYDVVNGKIELGEMDSQGNVYLYLYERDFNLFLDGIRQQISLGEEDFKRVVSTCVTSFIKEDAYIMDPRNFIIEKTQTQSKLVDKKYQHKTKSRQRSRATIMRPHYIVMGEKETVSFYKDTSNEPGTIRPVRGYVKTLVSDRFVNKKGQELHIAQYNRGRGNIDGSGGWYYKLLLKKDPVTLEYHQEE